MTPSRTFVSLSWIPLAFMAYMFWETSRSEGWGAWAVAAAMAPIMLGLSIIMTVLGAGLWLKARRLGQPKLALLLATLLASSPALWFAARILWLELQRSF